MRSAEVTRHAAQLERDGFVVIERAAPRVELARFRELALDDLEACFTRARALGLGSISVGAGFGYAEIVHRFPGSFELRHGRATDMLARVAAAQRTAWSPIGRVVLGRGAHGIVRGFLITEPRADREPWQTGEPRGLEVFLALA